MIICGYCNSDDSIQLYPSQDVFGNNYFIHKCNKCKAYFLAPRPDELLLKKSYNPAYYGESEESKFFPIIEYFIDYFRSSRARGLIRKLENLEIYKNTNLQINKLKVLDIGCGNGKFLSYINKYGNFELYGTELDDNSVKRASQIPGIHLVRSWEFGVGTFGTESFDAITLFHVFEHLTGPKLMLEIIANIIKKNGLLIISFPNIKSLQSRLFKGNCSMDPPKHLFFFSPDDFVDLMESFGFKLMSTKYFSFEQNPYGSIQSILNMLCKKREVLYERLKGNYTYAPEYSRTNIIFQKLFFFVTFPIFAFTEVFSSILKVGATVEFTFIKETKN